jgi:hypothetical protein
MTKVFGKLKEEPFALLPPTIFFFVAIYCTMHELVRVIRQAKGAADILWGRCLSLKFERRALHR